MENILLGEADDFKEALSKIFSPEWHLRNGRIIMPDGRHIAAAAENRSLSYSWPLQTMTNKQSDLRLKAMAKRKSHLLTPVETVTSEKRNNEHETVPGIRRSFEKSLQSVTEEITTLSV